MIKKKLNLNTIILLQILSILIIFLGIPKYQTAQYYNYEQEYQKLQKQYMDKKDKNDKYSLTYSNYKEKVQEIAKEELGFAVAKTKDIVEISRKKIKKAAQERRIAYGNVYQARK